MADKYELRRFRAVAKDEADYAQGTAWLRGVGIGFYDEPRKDDFADKIMAMYRVDNREMTGVYQADGVAAHSLAADVPVATFATLRKDLNIGYGRQLEAQLVTAVTVRGTHRRQGLLRRMMTEDLAAAKADGVALAALTASEASIYGRFGLRCGHLRAQHQGRHRAALPAAPCARRHRGDCGPQGPAGTGPRGFWPGPRVHARIDLAAGSVPAAVFGHARPGRQRGRGNPLRPALRRRRNRGRLRVL